MIELVAVLVAVGIVAGFVIHGAGRMSPRLTVGAEATRVASEVARTRALAIAEQRRFRLEFIGGRHMRVMRETDGTWSELQRPQTFPPHVTISIDGSPSGSIVFLGQGRVVAPATIVVLGRHRREIVSVWASGMTKRRLQ